VSKLTRIRSAVSAAVRDRIRWEKPALLRGKGFDIGRGGSIGSELCRQVLGMQTVKLILSSERAVSLQTST